MTDFEEPRSGFNSAQRASQTDGLTAAGETPFLDINSVLNL